MVAPGKLSVGIDGISDVYHRYPHFIRHDRYGRIEGAGGFTFRLTVSGVDYSGTELFDHGWVDANYELVSPLPAGATSFQNVIFALGFSLTRPASMAGVDMKMTWTGGAAVTNLDFGGDASNNVSVNLGAKTATFTYKATTVSPNSPGGFATTNCWYTFTLSGAAASPPQNIRIFEAANETRLNNGEVYDPVFLSRLQDYDTVRLMDMMQTNNNPAVNYTDLATDSFNFWQAKTGLASGQKVGIPASAIVRLANDLGRPVWICIPHQLTDSAITSLATDLKNASNVNTPPILVEYSNEDWNSAFDQHNYVMTQGALISDWSADSSFDQGSKFTGLRASQVMSIFRNVYGTNSGSRWKGVLAGWLAVTAQYTTMLVGVDYFLNPAKGLLRSGDTVTTLFSYMAGAPYFGPVPSSSGTEPGVTMKTYINMGQGPFNTFMHNKLKGLAVSDSTYLNVAFWRAQGQALVSVAAGRGLQAAMYEGGNGAQTALPLRDSISGETDGDLFNLALAQFASTREAGQIHNEIYTNWLADGGVMPMKFTFTGEHSKYGPWGLQEDLDDNNPCYLEVSQKFNAPLAPALRKLGFVAFNG